MSDYPYWVLMKDYTAHEESFQEVFLKEGCPHVILPERETFRVKYQPVIYIGKGGPIGGQELPYPTWNSEWFSLELISKNLSTLYTYHDNEIMTLGESKELGMRSKHVVDGEIYIDFLEEKTRRLTYLRGTRKVDSVNWGSLTDDTRVLVSTPKKILANYMCVVVMGEIAGYSRISINDQQRPRAYLPNPCRAVVDHLNKFYQPAPVYVVSIVETKDGWSVNDYSVFNHTRHFFDCDIRAIVQGIDDCHTQFDTYELPKMRPLIEESPSNKAVEAPQFEAVKPVTDAAAATGGTSETLMGGMVRVDIPPGVQVIKGGPGGVTMDQLNSAIKQNEDAGFERMMGDLLKETKK